MCIIDVEGVLALYPSEPHVSLSAPYLPSSNAHPPNLTHLRQKADAVLKPLLRNPTPSAPLNCRVQHTGFSVRCES
jgi:hypothetical protein